MPLQFSAVLLLLLLSSSSSSLLVSDGRAEKGYAWLAQQTDSQDYDPDEAKGSRSCGLHSTLQLSTYEYLGATRTRSLSNHPIIVALVRARRRPPPHYYWYNFNTATTRASERCPSLFFFRGNTALFY